MSGAKNKAKDRQSRNHEGYYNRLKDVVKINKLITMAKHIVRYDDRKQFDKLRQAVKMDLHLAHRKATSPKVKEVLAKAQQ